MAGYESGFWDQRYQSDGFLFGEDPADWLRNVTWRLPARGRALSVGDGEGRNGVWLACHGLTVETLDGSLVGVEKARALAARRGVPLTAHHASFADFSWIPADAPAGTSPGWDVVVSIFIHIAPAQRPAYLAQLLDALAPGGLLVLEGFHRRQRENGRTSGGPGDVDFLYTLEAVTEAFQALIPLEALEGTVILNEGPGHQGPAEVVRFLGKKPGP